MTEVNVSVVITTHNRPSLLKRAIHSVFAQSYTDYDLHIVDDGSKDDTVGICRRLESENERVFYWRHEHSRGLCAARNLGIKKSSGNYIAFLDDDDEWKPNSLEYRMAAVERLSENEREKIGVVYSGCKVMIPHEKRITFIMPRIQGNISNAIRTIGLSTIPSTALIPRKVLNLLGGFDENLMSSIDHDLWMSLAHLGLDAIAVPEPLTITYLHNRQKSMVSDTPARIHGVEQYLQKWHPVYIKWFGPIPARKYIASYRSNVLGRLSAIKFFRGNFREAWRLFFHVIQRNDFSFYEYFYILRFYTETMIRQCLPIWFLKIRDLNQQTTFK